MERIKLICIFVFVILFIVVCSTFIYNETTKIVLKCSINTEYSHFGQDLWDTFHDKLDSTDEYFLINLRNKTINNFDWEPLDNYKDIIIDKKIISMVEKLSDNTEINYLIQRNTGEISGVRTKEDKKYKSKTFYNYEGKCEKFNLKKKF